MRHFPAHNHKKVDLKPNLIRLLQSMKKYRVPMIIAIICMICSVVISIVAPQFLSQLTDTITYGAAKRNIDLNKIMHLGIVLVIFYMANAIFNFISNFIMNIITQRYSQNMRQQIDKKINRMELKYFDTHAHGDTLSRVTNDVDTMGQSLQQSVSMMIQSVFMLVGVLIAMFVTRWQMALTVLAILPLIGLFLMLVMKVAMPLFKKRQEYIGLVNGIVEENFTGQFIIKSFNAEEKKGKEFEQANQKLHDTMIKAQFFGGLFQPIMSFISYFAYAAVCIVGGLLMNKNAGVSFGTITAFLVYANLFQNPLSQIAQSMNTLQMAAASAQRVFEFLDEKEFIDDSDKPRLVLNANHAIQGKVEFKNVKFGYTEDKLIIKDFSVLIQPGMKVAIVGPTGAGKTTIVNLLMRFYEINSGNIYIDDVSIQDMSRKEIRDIFGMVLQDTWIFHGSVRDNIVYSKDNVDEQRLKEIIEDANLTHYISTLSHGVDTILNEDSSLSSGQKQLITIARAIAENAPLLILDEATSNVDTRTEILIQNAMDKLTKGRTSFVIAHRLSTIKNADIILVMKDGDIIEQGNHEQLMSKNGFYAALYQSQFANQ